MEENAKENGWGRWAVAMGTRSRVPVVPRPSRRVLSGIPDMRAGGATRPPLPQILPPQTPFDEVPPFTLLVLCD